MSHPLTAQQVDEQIGNDLQGLNGELAREAMILQLAHLQAQKMADQMHVFGSGAVTALNTNGSILISSR